MQPSIKWWNERIDLIVSFAWVCREEPSPFKKNTINTRGNGKQVKH